MSNPIRPKNHGLTPEAREALQAQGMVIQGSVEPDTNSETDEPEVNIEPEPGTPVVIPEPIFDFDIPPAPPVISEDGDSIVIEPTAVLSSGPGESRKPPREEPEPEPEREPKSGPPALDEWMHFFSKVLLRFICDYYISWAFSGVDEDLLSDREIERIKLTDEERKRIARPFAELSYKSKFMRKHGRTIVATGGAFDALVTLGAWTARVNRIAKKYRKPNPRQQRTNDERSRSGQPQPQANGSGYYNGTSGGFVDPNYPIVNPGS